MQNEFARKLSPTHIKREHKEVIIELS